MNYRNTKQKEILYNLIEMYGHLTTDEIKDLLHEKKEEISLATIYRNLSILTLENKIKLVKVGSVDVYETTKDFHYHFICSNCKKVFDIERNKVKIELDKSLDTTTSVELILHGLCSSCREKGEK